MSNKILAFIILLLIFGSIIWGYLYLFVFYGGNLELKWNISDFNIALSTDIVGQELNYACWENTCIYEDIPPLEYKVIISKSWYQDFISYKKIPGKWTLLLEFQLEKKVELTQLWTVETKDLWELASEKVTRLKYRDFYSYYDFSDAGVFYIREYLWKLFLYHDINEEERLVYDFKKVSHDKIHITPIYGTDYYNIFIDNSNYLFNIENTALRGIDLQQKIIYWKSWKIVQELVFITDVWSYVYNIKSRKSEYYVPFLDFTYLDDGEILWLIEKNDEKRVNNFGVSIQKERALFRYNLDTKVIKNIYETNDTIESFYQDDWKLYINTNWLLKQLKNY